METRKCRVCREKVVSQSQIKVAPPTQTRHPDMRQLWDTDVYTTPFFFETKTGSRRAEDCPKCGPGRAPNLWKLASNHPETFYTLFQWRPRTLIMFNMGKLTAEYSGRFLPDSSAHKALDHVTKEKMRRTCLSGRRAHGKPQTRERWRNFSWDSGRQMEARPIVACTYLGNVHWPFLILHGNVVFVFLMWCKHDDATMFQLSRTWKFRENVYKIRWVKKDVFCQFFEVLLWLVFLLLVFSILQCKKLWSMLFKTIFM